MSLLQRNFLCSSVPSHTISPKLAKAVMPRIRLSSQRHQSDPVHLTQPRPAPLQIASRRHTGYHQECRPPTRILSMQLTTLCRPPIIPINTLILQASCKVPITRTIMATTLILLSLIPHGTALRDLHYPPRIHPLTPVFFLAPMRILSITLIAVSTTRRLCMAT